MRSAIIFSLLISWVVCVMGDIYMQNPRGSNNRLNEANQDANNQQRLFDSQNNARGGYCWGPPLSFYTGSKLSIEWTNQHGCGSDEVHCNLVIQYMCTDENGDPTQVIRDGKTVNPTIPANADPAVYNKKEATSGDYLYGMHEPYSHYRACQLRYRNKGLFTADQAMGDRATSTRQDSSNTQYGFECPEERDYYPYWHPSPWKDIAVLVGDKKDCDFFKQNSQNVLDKNYCTGATDQLKAYNNKQDCLSNGGSWTSASNFGLDPPECELAPWSRDNHLGNSLTGFTSSYNWTLPVGESCLSGSCACVLRIRYNISTPHIHNWEAPFTDSTSNGANSPVKPNPYIMIGDRNLSLAVNTDQYGRTFQDRSHMFHLISRPNDLSPTTNIYNLNVRGKRGNIVQTYPATEYDFVPQRLHTKVGDYVHFQWTGCDTNPNGNAGEGTNGRDRSNIVQIRSYNNQFPLKDSDFDDSITPMFDSSKVRNRMAHLDQVGCLSLADLITQTNNNADQIKQHPQNCAKLNAADAYFNGGLIKMNNTGTFYYMSTRNNNFSNRTQKAVLIVDPLLPGWAIALIVIGCVLVSAAASLGGAIFYAKRHPHSRIAGVLERIPLVNRI